jgi:hypothetical protein
MSELFSINREFDFVRLDGLRRVTGRPSHEWDIYILKELIDNALDADELVWAKDFSKYPSVNITISYVDLPVNRRQLIIRVRNRASFPAERIEDIFNTGWYTSQKGYIKGLTRGSLGNALKTLLGIPYALRQRVAGDMSPELKPLSILTGGKEYLPQYIVNPATQTIELKIESRDVRRVDGTIIRVGIDHYSQQLPRQIEQLVDVAEQYHWCNPHAEFQWGIELNGRTYNMSYEGDKVWKNRYQGLSSIHWYSPMSFLDFMNMLYTNHCAGRENIYLPISKILDSMRIDERVDKLALELKISTHFGKKEFSRDEIQSVALDLYRDLCNLLPRLNVERLGEVGEDHLLSCISGTQKIQGPVVYSCTKAEQDPSNPFVLELCGAKINSDHHQIWTAINFSPTYGDPFMRRWLNPPSKPNDFVIGLHGFLDAYGVGDDVSLLVYMHLICPTIEHGEFSKTEINYLPFKNILESALDNLLNQIVNLEREKELKIEKMIYDALDEILDALKPDERFVADQLLEKLKARLGQEEPLKSWLASSVTPERLRMYISKYQSTKPVVTQWARPASEITVPLHPDRHFSIPAKQITADLLKSHHVNKIIYIHSREIEPVVVENGWLCQFDMAMLRNPTNPSDLEPVIIQCLLNGDYPLLILHDADEEGRVIVNRIQGYLSARNMKSSRVVDLGLMEQNNHANLDFPIRLVQMMPSELSKWLIVQLGKYDISIKSLPFDYEIRKEMRDHFENLLLSHLWDGISHQLQVSNLLNEIDRTFQISELMREQKLDEKLKDNLLSNPCKDSYEIGMKDLINRFYDNFMQKNSVKIRIAVRSHLEKYSLSLKNTTK